MSNDHPDKDNSEFKASLVVLYFLAVLLITSYARNHNVLTYGQLSIIYLPMFVLFIFWLRERIRDGGDRHSKLGLQIAIVLCVIVIITTLVVCIGSWTGLLQFAS